MLKRLQVIALALLLTTTSLVAADLYIGAGIGGNAEAGSFRRDLDDFSDSSGQPWKLFAGWSLGRHLAVEVGRHEFGDQSCCRGFADLGFTSKVNGFSASALGRWPVERFTPFIRAGVLAWEEDGEMISFSGPAPRSDDGTDLLFGVGLDFDLSDRFTARAEWEQYEFSGASSDSLWASLLFRF